MITVFIGQRGSGKTSLLKRIESYCKRLDRSAHFYDLDFEITRRYGRKISDIFESEGEIHFRTLEKKYFEMILSEAKEGEIYISVGGGFAVSNIPPAVRVIWLQRVSDSSGRIFLNRPSLESGASPLEEYQKRLLLRRPLFRQAAWEEYLIPEGLKRESIIESEILVENPVKVGGSLTLVPSVFATEERWKFFIERRLSWGIDFFEIRDDLLPPSQIEWALRDIPNEKILWARRCPIRGVGFTLSSMGLIDYDRAFAHEIPADGNSIVSVHQLEEEESFPQLFEKLEVFEKRGLHIKLAPRIANFEDLRICHQWRLQNPEQRSFLPRSEAGCWLWYRLWIGKSQKINFLREGEGSAPDQPSLYQWIQRHKNGTKDFAALLGDPVTHSFTPIFQGEFFDQYQIPILPILVGKEEFDVAFPFLESLGLLAAAVTSPLKISAYSQSQRRTAIADFYGSVNTLFRHRRDGWIGHNTDEEGLILLIKKARSLQPIADFSSVAVWGGGGTLPLLQKLLPEAKFYSIQSGQRRDGNPEAEEGPKWVVWAAGRLHAPGTVLPSQDWRPELVVDLNYRDDSGGLEFAQSCGARYLSGEIMFEVQAEYQRRFWKPLLEDI